MQENKNRPEGNVRPYKSVLDENASIYTADEHKSEKQKLAEMSWKERIGYFRSYYAIMLVAIIAAIAIVAFLIVHFLTTKGLVMGILAVNADGENVVAAGPEYFDDFLEENGVDTKKNTINLNYSMYI
ncbi:MAG: hypothetical protein GX913_03225, partial [Clostridiales bacterium]|nr:hypothetical protein [Clostridiales bacterium]